MDIQQLPKEIEMEQSVIVSILLEPEDRLKAFEKLSQDDFYSQSNKIIFSKCKQLQGNGNAIETAEIYSALSDNDKKFVKADYLFSLVDTVPVAINIESYIRKIKDAARHRRAIELANAIEKNAYKWR